MDAGHTQERPPRRHKTQSPGTIKTGSSRLTEASQAIHSRSNCHGRQSSVVASGSPAPERNPTSPPSTFAEAVAGNGVPAVRRLKTIHGVRMAEGTPHAIAVRDPVKGPPSHRRGISNTDSGRARAASPTSAADTAARPAVWAASAPVTRAAAKVTSMPDNAPQTTGALHTVASAAVNPSVASPVHTRVSQRATPAAASAATTPASFAHAGWAPPILNIPARSRVQRGAVEPATGTSGL